MDLSTVSNWAQILSSLAQMPQTIQTIRQLVGPKEKAVTELLAAQLASLTDGFRVLEELKTFHEQAQILHNYFSRVHQNTSSLQKMNAQYLWDVWRKFKTDDLVRFTKTMESLTQVKDALPQAEFKDLKRQAAHFQRVLRRLPPGGEVTDPRVAEEVIDIADEIKQMTMAILTQADSMLKRGIEEMSMSILQVERGVRGGGG